MLCHQLPIVLLTMVVLCSAATTEAQVTRLPTVTPRSGLSDAAGSRVPPPDFRLISHPDSGAELLQAPGEGSLPEQPERPPDARPGMFQKLIFDGESLPGGDADGFGISTMQLSSILALPIPSRTYPMLITPGFAVHYLDGPTDRDLPDRVYDAYTQFRWMRYVGPRWGIDLAVTTGMYSDFLQSTDEGFRITGHGAAAWSWTDTLKIALGVAYIDRRTSDFLPIAGIIWTPYDDVKYDLVFPHPRISRRVYWTGQYDDNVQDWIYLAGELGGGTWAIARDSGANDMVDYTDYRVYVGAERKVIGGLDARFEVGYVFGRKIRFRSATPDLAPPGTVMIRGGMTY